MIVRAKFTLDAVKTSQYQWGGSVTDGDPSKTYPLVKVLVFSAVYDNGTPENQRFTKATPSGTLEMIVDNPDALKQFELGKSYYLDFTLAE